MSIHYKNMRYFLILLATFAIFRAEAKPVTDDCVVHLDKAFYVTGEVMWYKIYLPTASRDRPFNIRVSLLRADGREVDYYYLQTEGKTYAEGYYKIPFNFRSGVYTLLFSAQESQNNRPVTLAAVTIPIYNDLQPLPQNITVSESPIKSFSDDEPAAADELRVNITLNKDTLQSREEVRVQITVTDQQGHPVQANLSASITDWALAGTQTLRQPTVTAGYPIPMTPLAQGIYFAGQVTDSLDNKLQDHLLGAFAPDAWSLTYAAMGDDRSFALQLPAFFGNRQIQFISYPAEDIDVSLETALTKKTELELPYTEGIIEYLTLSRQRKKIFQLYTDLEFSLNPERIANATKKPAADRALVVADYEAFEDVFTFLREISTPVAMKYIRKTDTYDALMYNPAKQAFFPEEPLFVVDGKLTRNADFVARLKMEPIDRIDLYFDFGKLFTNYQVMASSGIISLESQSLDLPVPEADAEDIFNVNGLQYPAAFPVFKPENVTPNQPFFRPQLYWNPLIETDANGRADFTFHQSDDVSTFRIQVVAQDAQGNIGKGSHEYVVRWQ